jgi:hypothetical protein
MAAKDIGGCRVEVIPDLALEFALHGATFGRAAGTASWF